MEYVQTVLVQIPAARLGEAQRPSGLLGELEAHRAIASARSGFRGMRITRSANPEGDALVVIETRWASNNELADYSTQEPNVASIAAAHGDEVVPNSLQVHRMQAPSAAASADTTRVYDRLALALLVPIGVLAFALLVVYGLSRIYLALPTEAATPLAAGIALGVLAIAAYFASHPDVPRWQIGGVFVVVLATLAIGGTAAAVYDEQHHEVKTPEAVASPGAGTPAPSGTPSGNAVQISAQNIAFDKTELTAAAGDVTIQFNNADNAIPHNFAIYRSPSDATDEIEHTDIAAGPVVQTLEVTLEPGTYFFDCQVHPVQMKGTLTVQ